MGEELVPDEIFGDDYLWFTEELLEQRSDQDVDTILGLLELPDGAELLDAALRPRPDLEPAGVARPARDGP